MYCDEDNIRLSSFVQSSLFFFFYLLGNTLYVKGYTGTNKVVVVLMFLKINQTMVQTFFPAAPTLDFFVPRTFFIRFFFSFLCFRDVLGFS